MMFEVNDEVISRLGRRPIENISDTLVDAAISELNKDLRNFPKLCAGIHPIIVGHEDALTRLNDYKREYMNRYSHVIAAYNFPKMQMLGILFPEIDDDLILFTESFTDAFNMYRMGLMLGSVHLKINNQGLVVPVFSSRSFDSARYIQ